ncbi:cytochrome c biogenesis protein ResB [Desulfatiferula olefinivorans]
MSRNKPPENLFDRIWNLFASVRFSVLILVLLAVTSIIGTLIPQNQQPVYYFRTFGETAYRVMEFLNLFDMYHSWWFRFLMMMLAMTLTVCSLERLPAVWKIVRKKPVYDAGRFKNLKDRHTVEPAGSFDDKRAEIVRLIEKTFGTCHEETGPAGPVFFSETGRWSRMGVYVVHGSILLLLLGGLIGSLWGFEGTMTIPEGETRDQVRLRNSDHSIPLDFAIRCDDFTLSHYDNGAPSEYRSDLTILDQGREILKKSIIVNDPLRFRGINVFQSSFGVLAGDTATLTFTSTASGMNYERTVTMNTPLDLPENLGTFTLAHHMNAYPFMGHDLGECFIGHLETADGKREDVILPIRFNGFDKMRKGAVTVAVADYEKRHYTGLQVTRDPGVLLVYLGFILMIVGCWTAFFMSHQRVCVEIQTTGEGRCRVTVSGTANKNKLGTALKLKQLASRIKDA